MSHARVPEALIVANLRALFDAMVCRGETRERAQRFTLQCAIALFAEHGNLIPRGSFAQFVEHPAKGTSFLQGVDGIALAAKEASLLAQVAEGNWEEVQPSIFGVIFQSLMAQKKRHEQGAHYTPEAAIVEYVVRPSVIDPWRKRIEKATSIDELFEIRQKLADLRILDPACGSGNFLYVAYRALKELELELVDWARKRFMVQMSPHTSIHPRQFYGIDTDPLAIDLAKVTLSFAAQQTSWDEQNDNFQCADALFCAWPKVDVIIGNPPFQSKNKRQKELGADYVRRLRDRYPDVPGRADYCVYWFKRAHEELGQDATAGLVGTNTIRQNYSREGGLDHIVNNGGTITEAVANMVWPGEAVVQVSVVNWVKGKVDGPKKISWQEGNDLNGAWNEKLTTKIPSSLSEHIDVTRAKVLQTNAQANACHQGQTHGHVGFLLSQDEATSMIAASEMNREVLYPFLIGEDLLNDVAGRPSRWVIDFHPRLQQDAQRYELPFQRIQARVLPDRQFEAREEKKRNASLPGKGNKHHENFLKRWWMLSYPRGKLVATIAVTSRWIACSRVTKRPIFEFVSSRIRPNDALMVFPFEDDYSFGILQSGFHGAWFKARCSTLKGDSRYTSNTVFDSFPWPQHPTEKQCRKVAEAAKTLREVRRHLKTRNNLSLRAMYLAMEASSTHPLVAAHAQLDEAVREAYGAKLEPEPLEFLLALNLECAAKEAKSLMITGPGMPEAILTEGFVTGDAIEALEIDG